MLPLVREGGLRQRNLPAKPLEVGIHHHGDHAIERNGWLPPRLAPLGRVSNEMVDLCGRRSDGSTLTCFSQSRPA